MRALVVHASVTCEIVQAQATLVEERTFFDGGDGPSYVTLPRAWLGTVWLRFRIGKAVTTKRMKVRAVGEYATLDDLDAEARRLVERHGVILDQPIPWSTDPAPSPSPGVPT